VRERLRQLKGKLTFETASGGGTKATVTIPLPKNNS
jgi:signal transduction histidine kinase